MHPASHTHSLYNSLYPGYSPYPQQKLQASPPPPPPPHNRTTTAHCWPSSHSVTDILAGVHAAAAFRGTTATATHPPGSVPGTSPTPNEHAGSPQNYNYYMYLQSGNTAMAAAHVAAAGMAHAHHGLATGSPI